MRCLTHKAAKTAQITFTEVNYMKLNCGDTCPKSGKYNVIDGNGKVINSVYVNEGETMPPTQYSDCHYESQS